MERSSGEGTLPTMHLTLNDGTLRIELSWWMKLLACRFSPLELPVASIEHVSTKPQKTHWNELRMPGTFIPGLIKAGTYRREGRKDFWCITRDQPVLRLNLKNERFDSLILGIQDNDLWASRLNRH